jgi:hypothetical protein
MEVTMRFSIVIVLVAAVAVGASVTAGRPAFAQNDAFPFRAGDTVEFTYGGGGTHTCRIEEIRGTFARCERPLRSEAPFWWVNVGEVQGLRVKLPK